MGSDRTTKFNLSFEGVAEDLAERIGFGLETITVSPRPTLARGREDANDPGAEAANWPVLVFPCRSRC